MQVIEKHVLKGYSYENVYILHGNKALTRTYILPRPVSMAHWGISYLAPANPTEQLNTHARIYTWHITIININLYYCDESMDTDMI